MHPNSSLLERLFAALNRKDHKTMAACYHRQATFHDIAFDLPNMVRDIAFDLPDTQAIPVMWHMICERSNVVAEIRAIDANDVDGRVDLVDTYNYKKRHSDPGPGRPVRNHIDCRFRFRDGLIVEHIDHCDPIVWAGQAIGGVKGFAAGRIRWLRSNGAKEKLEDFLKSHVEYKRTA